MAQVIKHAEVQFICRVRRLRDRSVVAPGTLIQQWIARRVMRIVLIDEKQDIGGFDVAMDDTMLMSSIDGPCKSGKQLNGFGRRGRSSRSRGARYVVSQALSLDIFQGEAAQTGRAVRIPRGQRTSLGSTHQL